MRVGKHDRQRLRAGLDHAHTLTARNNFAGWGDGPGMPASAAAFEDLLTDDLRVLGPDHADTRTTRISLPPRGSRPLKMYRRLCSNSRRRRADRSNFTRLDEQRSPSFPAGPVSWTDHMLRALELPQAFAAFLSRVVGLATSGAPPVTLGFRLEAQHDMAEFFDTTGLHSLPSEITPNGGRRALSGGRRSHSVTRWMAELACDTPKRRPSRHYFLLFER